MVMAGHGHQAEEAAIYVCAMGVERRDKGSALFHIMVLKLFLKVRNIDSLPTLISTNVERRFHLH